MYLEKDTGFELFERTVDFRKRERQGVTIYEKERKKRAEKGKEVQRRLQ